MKSAKLLLGAIAGVAIGIQIGVLIAPEKGVETRKKLSKKGDDYLDELNNTFNKFIEGVTEKLDKVNKNAGDLGDSAQQKTRELRREAEAKIK